MQHFKTRMTKLKNLINRFPEMGDIFGFPGVTKNVLLTALDTAYDLSQGINDDDANNQLIIISLKRMSSAFYTKYKNVLDSDSALPESSNFDEFIDNKFPELSTAEKTNYRLTFDDPRCRVIIAKKFLI